MVLSEGLKTETITVLEEIATTSQNPALSVNLGQLYQSAGSNDQAEKTYTKAIELAKAANEPVEQILAKAGLVQVLTAQGKKQEGERLLAEVTQEVNALQAEDRQKASSSCNPTCTQVNNNCGACCRDGRQGKCVYIYGINKILCRTLICPQ